MPTGKLGIDLDGSWVSSTYLSSGPKPWPQYSKVLGVAPMPTENGQGPAHVSLSGGWLLSVGSHGTSAQKQMAFNYITIALDQKNSLWYDIHGGQVATRARRRLSPFVPEPRPVGGDVLDIRPLYSLPSGLCHYPKLSDEIQVITGQVMTGQQTPAQGVAAYNKYLISTVGASNVENAPA